MEFHRQYYKIRKTKKLEHNNIDVLLFNECFKIVVH